MAISALPIASIISTYSQTSVLQTPNEYWKGKAMNGQTSGKSEQTVMATKSHTSVTAFDEEDEIPTQEICRSCGHSWESRKLARSLSVTSVAQQQVEHITAKMLIQSEEMAALTEQHSMMEAKLACSEQKIVNQSGLVDKNEELSRAHDAIQEKCLKLYSQLQDSAKEVKTWRARNERVSGVFLEMNAAMKDGRTATGKCSAVERLLTKLEIKDA